MYFYLSFSAPYELKGINHEIEECLQEVLQGEHMRGLHKTDRTNL